MFACWANDTDGLSFFGRLTGEIVHHDPRRDGGIQGFGAAAHGQAQTMGSDSFYLIGDAVSLVADDENEGRTDILPLIEGIPIQLGRQDGKTVLF